MFWNGDICNASSPCGWWTLNMKCFEIIYHSLLFFIYILWTLNMKCFEIVLYLSVFTTLKIWTLNMKCFEITQVQRNSVGKDVMNLKHEMFWN